MKHINTFLAFLIFLSASVIRSAYPNEQENTDINFNISTNSIYFPGETINLNLYSYDNSQKKGKNAKLSFFIQILKIKDLNEFYSRQVSRSTVDVLGRDSTNLTYLTEEYTSFYKNISMKDDYGYFYLSETIPVSVTVNGAYVIKVTSNNKVAYCGFVITSGGVISKAGSNAILAFAVDRKSGVPVSNAELSIYIGDKFVGKGITKNGLFYQEISQSLIQESTQNVYPLIIGQYGSDVFISDPYLYFGYNANNYVTYLYTNQPVYRTDSEVLFKGTLKKKISTGYESYANQDLNVVIKDSRGAEVYKNVLRTNSIGSFDGSYKIDKEAPLGNYNIIVQIGDKYTYTSAFTVEQFKKPEYKVTVTADKNQYFGKDLLKASIEAKYFFGSPVQDAEVEYNVYKVRYYKPWWSFSEYSWWYEDYYSSLDENSKYSGAEFIYTSKGKLNKEGKLDIEYAIKEDFKDENQRGYNWYWRNNSETDYKYIIQAKVVDKSRREISGTASVFVTRGGFYLNAKVDRYIYKPGENVNIEVRSYDFSDKPVQTQFTVDLYKTTWGRYDYKEKKDFIKTISGSTKSDGLGIVSYDIPAYDADGSYLAEIKAKDDRGNPISTSAYFYVSQGDMWWYYNQSGAVQIITDKDSYRKGDTCKALIINSSPGINALITTQDNNIIFYKSEKFDAISGIVEIPIDNKYRSSFDISVSYVKEGQFYSASKSLMIIPDENFLTVLIDPSKLIYKPKEEGLLRIKVVDKAGNPVKNAEVSIGIVDESIYSIKEDNTKDIRQFFYGKEFTSVSTTFNTQNSSYGYSRLISIYERFNIKSTKESDLATVKGRLLTKNNIPIQNASIVVDENYIAATTDSDGNFEFKLPEGKYSVGVYYKEMKKEDLKELNLQKGKTYQITLYNDKELNEIVTQPGILDGAVMNGRVNQERVEVSPSVTTKDGKKNSEKKDKSEDLKGVDEEEKLVEADVRSDFRDAIYWSPYTTTDNEGYCDVKIKYPDNLTSWRITSRVITEDTKVGQSVKTVITRKDLLVRMETPRFLQQNDEVTIATLIHNYLSTDKNVKLKFKADNVTLIGDNQKTISLAANSEQRVDWKIKVTEPVGEGKLYAEALTNEESDAVEIKVPMQPKGLEIVQSVVTDIGEDSKTEIKNIFLPSDVDLRSAAFKFVTSPSLASTILTSLDELAGYPYGCVEQTMSRFLPTVVVADALKEINAPLSDKTKNELPKMVEAGINRLYGFQHSDGGWGWWTNDGSQPFMTAYVLYGLNIAKNSGYNIKDDAIKKGINHLKQKVEGADDPTTKAFVLYVLSSMNSANNDLVRKEAMKLLKEDINNYALSLAALALYNIGDRSEALNAVNKLELNVKYSGDNYAYWEGKTWHYNWQDDKVQTTAAALKAIVTIKPQSETKDKIIRWLMMQRQGLSWRSTQETAMIIYAMVDYLKISKELDPDYKVIVSLNGEKVFEKTVTKEDVFKKDDILKIPGSKLKAGYNEVKIEKNGRGKVYFSAYSSHYQSSGITSKEDGFRVEREYFKLEKYESYVDNNITYRKKYFEGNVNSGDMILVKVKVFSKDNDYNYFMLEDPIPAGCEVTKDDWAFKIDEEKDFSGYESYYWRWWYADKDVRDNKVTFFATYINKGEMSFSYIMRAQIPGDYSINPSRAMLMYYTDLNGSSTDLKLKINE